MKSCVLIVVLSLVASSLQDELTFSALLKKWVETSKASEGPCIEETKVDPTLAQRLIAFGEFVEDPKLKCYTRCSTTKLGLFDAEGKIQQEVFGQLIKIPDPSIQEKIGGKCLKHHSDDKCEQSFITVKCIYKTTQALLKP